MLLHSATVTTLSDLALKLIRKDTQSCKQLHGTITKRKHRYAIENIEDNYFISLKREGKSLVLVNYSPRGWTSP